MEEFAKKVAFGIKVHVWGEKRHGKSYGHNENDSIGINNLATFGLIGTTSRNAKTERMEELDCSYKDNNTFEFKPGTAFKVIWTEPIGREAASVKIREMDKTMNDGARYYKVRRFVVVNLWKRNCIRLPATIYSDQRKFKKDIGRKGYKVIYTGKIKARPLSDNRYAQETDQRCETELGWDSQGKTNELIQNNFGMASARKSNLISSLCAQKSLDDLHDIPSPLLIDKLDLGEHTASLEFGPKEHGEEQDGAYRQWQTCHTCGEQKYGYDIDRGQYHGQGHFELSSKALAVIGLGSGLAMGASFLWLSTSMGLNETSPPMDWITKEFPLFVPQKLIQPLKDIPDGFRFCIFVLATAIFTGTIFIWISKMLRLKSKVRGVAVIMIILVGCTIAGVTTEELLLVCLPSSLGVVMLLHSPFGTGREKALLVDEEQ